MLFRQARVSSTDTTLLSDPIGTNRIANLAVTSSKIAEGAVSVGKLNLSKSVRIISDNPRYLQCDQYGLSLVTDIQIVKPDGTYMNIPSQSFDMPSVPIFPGETDPKNSSQNPGSSYGGRTAWLYLNLDTKTFYKSFVNPFASNSTYVLLGCCSFLCRNIVTQRIAQYVYEPAVELSTIVEMPLFFAPASGATAADIGTIYCKPQSNWTNSTQYRYKATSVSYTSGYSCLVTCERHYSGQGRELPESIWCTSWHPACPVLDAYSWTMVYDPGTNIAVDIYPMRASNDSGISCYPGTPCHSGTFTNLVPNFLPYTPVSLGQAYSVCMNVGKRLPTYQECISYSLGAKSGCTLYQETSVSDLYRNSGVIGKSGDSYYRMTSFIGVERPLGTASPSALFWTSEQVLTGTYTSQNLALGWDNYTALGSVGGLLANSGNDYLLRYNLMYGYGSTMSLYGSSIRNEKDSTGLCRGVCDVSCAPLSSLDVLN